MIENKKENKSVKSVSLDPEEMAQAGLHFGHRTSRIHPKMKPYISGTRNTVHIIDLEKTTEKLKQALDFIKEYGETNCLNDLIDAGNYAGKAINITGTNIVHSLSYGLTIKYGLPHGEACSVFLKDIYNYFLNNKYPLKLDFMLDKFPKLDKYKFEYDKDWVIEHALSYDKSKPFHKENLKLILK